MTQDEICPGCGRGCLLSAPTCGKGFEIARERADATDGQQGEGHAPHAQGEYAPHAQEAHGRMGHGSHGERGGRREHGRGGSPRGGRGGEGVREGRECDGPRGDWERGPRGGRGGEGPHEYRNGGPREEHDGPRGGYGGGPRGGYGDGPRGGRGGRGHGHPRGEGGFEGRGHGHARGSRRREERPERIDEATDALLVRRFHHCAHLLMHRRAKEGGRVGVLMVLNNHGAMTQRALAEKLDIRPASASELLSKMEASRLVERTPDPDDGRASLISLTEEGREEAGVFAKRREEANKNLFAALSDEEKQQLEHILAKLTRSWHEEFDREDERAADRAQAAEEE